MEFNFGDHYISFTIDSLINFYRSIGKTGIDFYNAVVSEINNALPDHIEIIDDKEVKQVVKLAFLNVHKAYKSRGDHWDRITPAEREKEHFFDWEDDKVELEPAHKKGRTRKGDFHTLGVRQKFNRMKEFSNFASSELLYAAKTSFRKEGQKSAVAVCSRLESSPTRGQAMNTSLEMDQEVFNDEEALQLMLQLKLTVNGYHILKRALKDKGCDVLPSYYKLERFQRTIIPADSVITEDSAEVNLQHMMDKTAISISKLLDINIPSDELLLRSKWGCDGSSGHSLYKQTMGDRSGGDTSIFMMSMVPLQLETKLGQVLWRNPKPNSKDYCRPLKFRFKKEDEELVQEEVMAMEIKILNLQETTIGDHKVKHSLQMTMVDQKVINHCTNTRSSANCYICGATPNQMNTIAAAERPQEVEGMDDTYVFGVSSLHAYLNCFTCLLHIGYKLPIRKWRAGTPEDHTAIKSQKKLSQDEFAKVGLCVDMPKGTSGKTNETVIWPDGSSGIIKRALASRESTRPLS